MFYKAIFKIIKKAFSVSTTVMTFFLLFSPLVRAQNRPELFFTSDLEKNKLTYDSELSFEIQQDQLRSNNNPNKTNIRNLSLGLNFNESNNKLRFEFLGEQNPLSNDVNMNLGEFYFVSRIKNIKLPTEVFVGASKLEYGLLNDLDGVLRFLPSYYSVLYDLPRGIDSGFGMNTLFLNKSVSLSSFLYLGRNLRQVDAQNQALDIPPHHFKLSYNQDNFKFSLNYFSRKYELQALVQGLGIEFLLYNQYFFNKNLSLNLNTEAFVLRTSLNGIQNNGLTALFYPELEFKSIILRTIYSLEQWTQNQALATQSYLTLGLGYEFSKNIKAFIESSEIQNITNDLVKEQSFQFRIVSNWNF